MSILETRLNTRSEAFRHNALQMQADKEAVGQAIHDRFFASPREAMTGNRRF